MGQHVLCEEKKNNIDEKNVIQRKEEQDQFFEKKTTFIEEKKDTPVRFEESEDEDDKDESQKHESLHPGSYKSNKTAKYVSTKGLSPVQTEKILQAKETTFKEEFATMQIQQIQVKKVKVKWNDFIKLKNKKFTDDYQIVKEIGRGGFGRVYKALLRGTQLYRAAKKIEKASLKEQQTEDLLGEMAIMMSLDHPNIVKLYEVYDQAEFYVMVMELCEGGELFQKIVKRTIKENEAIHITRQILSAINYMHYKGIVHRDIKPQNMLFESDTKILKIIDFGISTKINKKQILNKRLGTPYYIAPQVLLKRYNQKCDIWSIGIVVYMIFAGEPPFKGNELQEVANKIMNDELVFRGVQWKNYSSDGVDFLRKVLKKNPNDRLNASKALDHPWLLSVKEENKVKMQRKEQILQSMLNFKFKNKLEAVVQTYIVSQLIPSAAKKQLLLYFNEFDQNKNGVIEIDEIKSALTGSDKLAKTTDKQIQQMIDYVDTNCSGVIDYTQFLVAAFSQKEKITKEYLKLAFRYFDIDGSGSITFKQISQFLEEGTDYIQKVFKAVDENSDGIISLQEFIALFNQSKK